MTTLSLAPLSFLLLCGLLTAQTADVIYRDSSGKTVTKEKVRISTDSYTRFSARGVSVSPSEVVRVVFRDAPEGFMQAQQAYEDQDYEGVEPGVQKYLSDRGRKRYLDVYAYHYLARARHALGDHEGAKEACENLLNADAKHRLVPDAISLLGEMELARGAAPQAKKHYERLVTEIGRARGADAAYGRMGRRGLATVEARFGNAKRAIADLEKLEAEASGNERSLIELEIGNAHVRLKEPQEAAQIFRKILDGIDNETDPRVVARAANGLGDAQLAQKQFEEALRTYSRTYSLFFERNDLLAEVSHALYNGGLAFDFQSGLENANAEKKALYRRRAILLWRRAAQMRFQGTAGFADARKKLGR